MVLVSIFMLTLKVVSASAETNSIENASSNEFDWNPVMEAIIQVESGGDRYAKVVPLWELCKLLLSVLLNAIIFLKKE